jgi:branched-chain amino acid transport system substrate-binding protein
MAEQEIRIGALATLLGPFKAMGEDGIRGVELAIAEFGGEVAGLPINLIVEGTNAIPDNAQLGAQTLLDKHRVDFIIGPLSGNEGLAVRDFARIRPERAFLNGNAATQDITLRHAAPNFYHFGTHGVQWMAGLGSYAYETMGYRQVVTIAEDYSYPHGQVGGFMVEFCRAGGRVIGKFWVPLGTNDFSRIIEAIPPDIDAVFVALAGADALSFLKQFVQAGGNIPLIAGTSAVDQTVLGVRGALSDRLVGTVSAGPVADTNPHPAWETFVQNYQEYFPGGLPFPSQVACAYYTNTKAALLALTAVEGDLSDWQTRFKEALSCLEFECPTGPVKLDHNRQAIATNFVTQIAKSGEGTLYTEIVQTIPEVNSTLGMDEDEFLALGPFNADNPSCP